MINVDKPKTYVDKYLKDEVDVRDFAIFLINKLNEKNIAVDVQPKAIVDVLSINIKPILSEDEKVILRHMSKKRNFIGRFSEDDANNSNELYICEYCNHINFNYLKLIHVFDWIKPRRRI